MAKKRSGARTKKAANDTTKSELGREIIAIALVAVAILLLIAFTGAGGALADGLINTLKVVIGVATYGLPILLLFLAWRLFVEDVQTSRNARLVGVTLLTISITGLLHVFIEQDQSLIVAQDGGGGGFIGYLASRGVLSLLSTASAAVLFFAAMLIALVLVMNIKISEVFAALVGRLRSRTADDLASQLEQTAAQAPKINAKVPLVSGTSTDAGVAAHEEPEVLTSPIPS